MRLVLIEWEDSLGCSTSWEKTADCRPQVLICRSVGWLLHDGEDCKTVVPHLSKAQESVPQQGCGDMTIPTRAIIRMADLVVSGF